MPDLVLLGILLCAGATFGMYVLRGLPSAHALLNAESITALAFLILGFLRTRPLPPALDYKSKDRLTPIALAGAVAIAYFQILKTPFIYDDYTHLADAAHSTWSMVLSAFGPVSHKPGLFFRPVGFLLYWFNYWWAGTDPWRWHLTSMMLHTLNSCLLWALCRALGLSRWAGFGAALFFALNACSVESVAWLDAIFDPLAASFALATLLFVCRFLRSERRGWLILASVTTLCAVLSKESAFFLPLLVGCLFFFRAPEERPRLWMAGGWILSLAAALFVYRWWALGGIGGYRTDAASPDILRFQPVHTLNALLVRDWTVLLFPVNWSIPVSPVLRTALAVTPVVFAVFIWWARPPRRQFLGCLAFTLAAALPVQHLLLLGADLSGSRILYLPAVGWAVLWGILFSSIERPGGRALAIVWVLLLQSLLLRHNLSAWQTVPRQAQLLCAEFGRTAANTSGKLIVRGLPQTRTGVPFLANGFPECVEMNSGIPRERIQVGNSAQANFAWNPKTGRVEPIEVHF